MISHTYFDVFGNRRNPGQFFFGGGKPSLPKQEKVKMPKQEPFQIPVSPAPEPIPPPPTQSKLEVQQAEEDARQQNARRKGVRQTLIAGETGGAMTTTGEAKKTLLG